MATGNKSLARFDLVGIPPAPRGMPQIEVTFDIDANGIVHVHAKDLGTGKEQSVQVRPSSGLSDEEIQKMVKDAESHSEEDKKKSELIHARNSADNVIYTSEKSLKEHGEKVDEATRKGIQDAIDKAKKTLTSDDVSEINKAIEELTQASYKLSEHIYKEAQQKAQSQSSASGPSESDKKKTEDGGKENKGKDDDVIDADYKEVK